MNTTNLTLDLKGHFLRLYQMAFADDSFNKLELQMLYNLAESRGISKVELDALLVNPVFEDATIPDDVTTRIEYLYDLTQMIMADGIVTEDEKITLKKYCRKFEFLDENLDDIVEFFLTSALQGRTKQDIIDQLNA